MGASTDDMINQLQAQLAQPPQPSLFGLSAPPDPSGLTALLAKLKQQQFNENANRPTGGQYGYLHDAGKQAFTDVGQQVGTALGGAANAVSQPPPGATPAPPSPQAQIAGAIQQATRMYQQLVAGGVDENAARQAATKQLVAAGVPGASDVLAKTNQQGLDNDFKGAETAKDKSQAAMDADNINVHGREEKQNTWATIQTTPEYTIQKNALGEVRSVKTSDKASLPQTPEESANADAIAQKIANYDLDMPTAVGRGSLQARQDMLGRVLKINPDFDVQNFKQANDALKAYGPSGTQGQQILKTQNAMNHLSALDQYYAALKSNKPQIANSILNSLSTQLGGTEGSTVEAVAPIVASEVASSLVKGGGGVKEREDKAKELGAKLNLTGAQASGNINAMRSLLGAQYKNAKGLYEKTALRKDFEDRFPIDGGFPPPPGTSPQGAPASGGWGSVTKVGG